MHDEISRLTCISRKHFQALYGQLSLTSSLSKTVFRFVRCTKGNVLLLAAAGMPLFIGAAGLSTDTVLWTLWQRELQRSADSAAIAGAFTVQQARYKAEKAAIHDFQKSKAFTELKANMWFENSPHQGPWKGDEGAVLVRIRLKTSLPFSNFFLRKPVLLEAEATASMIKGTDHCLIALDQESAGAIDLGGSANLNLNCAVASNSKSRNSVSASGSSSIEALFVTAVGGIPDTSHFRGSTKLKPYGSPQIDPLSALPRPKLGGTCEPKKIVESNEVATLSPGCYEGMDLKGIVNLNAGTYYIAGADLDIGSGARVYGEGVTFILTDNGRNSRFAQINMNGHPNIQISAPTSGDYKHMLFYQDPDAPYNDSFNKINGSASSFFKGNFYFPNQGVSFLGDTNMNLDCFKLIARRLSFSGNATFRNQCPQPDTRFGSQTIRLVA